MAVIICVFSRPPGIDVVHCLNTRPPPAPASPVPEIGQYAGLKVGRVADGPPDATPAHWKLFATKYAFRNYANALILSPKKTINNSEYTMTIPAIQCLYRLLSMFSSAVKRKGFVFAAVIMGCVVAPGFAHAQNAIELTVGFPAGSGVDQIGRALARHLQGNLGRPVVVDNRSGNSGVVAAQRFQTQPAGDSRLLFATATIGFNTGLPGEQSGVHPLIRSGGLDGMTPVATIGVSTLALAANANVRATTISELRGDILTPGENTAPHFFALALQRQSAGGIRSVLPRRGGAPALADTLNNPEGIMVAGFNELRTHVASERIRILAVSGNAVPAWAAGARNIRDFGAPQAAGLIWYGVFAPPGTPPAAVSAVQRAVASALTSADMQAVLTQYNIAVFVGDGAQLAEWVNHSRP